MNTELKRRAPKNLVGKRVFIPELDVEGTVVDVDGKGNVTKVKTAKGVIDTINMIIDELPTVLTIIESLIKLFKRVF